MAKNLKNRIYDLKLWKDEPRQAVHDTLQGIFSDCIRLGTKLGMTQPQLEHMFKLRDRVPQMHSMERWTEVCFSIVTDPDTSWYDLSVKLTLDLNQNYSDGEITAKVLVRWDGGKQSPDMAAKMGTMLSEVSMLAHEVQRTLNEMIDAIPDDAICPAKELADNETYNRRLFISHNTDDFYVRRFIEETLLPMYANGANTLVHRFEGKERKLLNKVPEEIATVEHKRGGPSTITLTQGTLSHLAQKAADEKAKTILAG